MSDLRKTDLSIDKVQKSIDLIIKIADSMAKVIPGDIDDKVIFILKQFADQPWFAELVVTLIESFGPQNPPDKAKAILLVSEALARNSK